MRKPRLLMNGAVSNAKTIPPAVRERAVRLMQSCKFRRGRDGAEGISRRGRLFSGVLKLVTFVFLYFVDVMYTREAMLKTAKSRAKSGAWQAEKSELTRRQILQATVRCLVRLGYAETLTETIAKEAGVSRGAIRHYFKSRADTFRSVAQFIVSERVAEFGNLVTSIQMPASGVPDLQSFRKAMQLMQEFYWSPYFIAYHELLRGARGDPSLTDVLKTLGGLLDRSAYESLQEHMPWWRGMEETRNRLLDVVLASMHGIAVNPVQFDKERAAQIADTLANLAYREFSEAYAKMEGRHREPVASQ